MGTIAATSFGFCKRQTYALCVVSDCIVIAVSCYPCDCSSGTKQQTTETTAGVFESKGVHSASYCISRSVDSEVYCRIYMNVFGIKCRHIK